MFHKSSFLFSTFYLANSGNTLDNLPHKCLPYVTSLEI